MSVRKIKVKDNGSVEKCPKCGNNIEFTAHSQQVAEDMCEVWVVCKCGYDPTENNSLYRLEDVWGGCNDGNCLDALSVWNDLVASNEVRVIPKPTQITN